MEVRVWDFKAIERARTSGLEVNGTAGPFPSMGLPMPWKQLCRRSSSCGEVLSNPHLPPDGIQSLELGSSQQAGKEAIVSFYHG